MRARTDLLFSIPVPVAEGVDPWRCEHPYQAPPQVLRSTCNRGRLERSGQVQSGSGVHAGICGPVEWLLTPWDRGAFYDTYELVMCARADHPLLGLDELEVLLGPWWPVLRGGARD